MKKLVCAILLGVSSVCLATDDSTTLETVGSIMSYCPASETYEGFLLADKLLNGNCAYLVFDASTPSGQSALSIGLTAISTKKEVIVVYDDDAIPFNNCIGSGTVCKLNSIQLTK